HYHVSSRSAIFTAISVPVALDPATADRNASVVAFGATSPLPRWGAMSAPWGTPPWTVDVAVPVVPPPSTVDVAIVGAGFAGLATAYELARRGVPVAVFEAGRIGAGASGRTGAIALEGTAAGLLEDADTCLAALARIARETAPDCDLRLDGCWEIAHGEQPGTPPW